MFSIKHKEGKKASLMLLKGKNDNQLKGPVNFSYDLEIQIHIQEPYKTTAQGRRGIIYTVQLPDNLVTSEIADIDLRERELLNYEMVVRLVPAIDLSPQASKRPTRECFYCFATYPIAAACCPECGAVQ